MSTTVRAQGSGSEGKWSITSTGAGVGLAGLLQLCSGGNVQAMEFSVLDNQVTGSFDSTQIGRAHV